MPERLVRGVDVSHWQGRIDWPRVKAAGYEFAILKATESTNYVDPTFAGHRAQARAAGLTVGAYHFARAGDPAREADYFCRAVGRLADSELVVLDWEVAASNAPGWCKTWLDRVTAQLGVRPLIYMNQSAARGSNWAVVANYPLWLAKYDSVTTNPGPIGGWSRVAIKQYTDRGAVPGIAGGVDVNVLYGDKTTLAGLTKGGQHTSGGFLMALSDTEQDEILAYVREHRVGITGKREAGKPGGMMLHGMEQALGRVEVKLAAIAADDDVAELVAALRPVMSELVEKVLEAGADADAEAIVDEFLERLSAGTPKT